MGILDKSFVYRNAASTNVKLTFARERARLKQEALAKERAEESKLLKVAARKIGGKS